MAPRRAALYIAALMVCIPSIAAALAVATCRPPPPPPLQQQPPACAAPPPPSTEVRCRAGYAAAAMVACLCAVYAMIWVLTANDAPFAAVPAGRTGAWNRRDAGRAGSTGRGGRLDGGGDLSDPSFGEGLYYGGGSADRRRPSSSFADEDGDLGGGNDAPLI